MSDLLTPSLSATYLVFSVPLLSSFAIVGMRICLHIRRRHRITSSFLARPSRPHRTNGVFIKAAELTIPQQIRRR